jgi:hypothetical protein
MTTRRRIHIDVELPKLTPAQARFLSNFLDDLAADLWDAYEAVLLHPEDEPELDNDCVAPDPDDFQDGAATALGNDETDDDF